MKRIGLIPLGMAAAFLAALPVRAQQVPKAATNQPNKLITGKLVYVGPMPHGLGAWLIQDLKDWGKYTPTQEQEGADLVLESHWPRRRLEFVMRQGIPVPRREKRRKRKKEPIIATITVSDWVTGARLWRADLLDEKPKHRAREVSPGAETKIRMRGMSSSQLAETIVRRLHAYVTQLERQGGTGSPLLRRP